MQRREFIKNTIAGGVALTLPLSVLSGCRKQIGESITFGVCADVHKDIMHDANERLKKFIDVAQKAEVDFIIQLGDFCRPYQNNNSFLKVWESFQGEKYHVLGNHDMDGGFSRDSVLKFWSAVSKYYSFDSNEIHFIVLDGNDIDPSPDKASGYARFIGKEQQNWLKRDLRSTHKHVVIFSHQSLENDEGVENRIEIRKILTNENKRAGFTKIIACFSGHHHTDYYTQIDDIYYVQINSMSYSWLGDKYKTIRYSKEIDAKYPWIKYTVPYKEPLFAMVKINNSAITISGKKSEFVGPGPKELGVPKIHGAPIVPYISNRNLKY